MPNSRPYRYKHRVCFVLSGYSFTTPRWVEVDRVEVDRVEADRVEVELASTTDHDIQAQEQHPSDDGREGPTIVPCGRIKENISLLVKIIYVGFLLPKQGINAYSTKTHFSKQMTNNGATSGDGDVPYWLSWRSPQTEPCWQTRDPLHKLPGRAPDRWRRGGTGDRETGVCSSDWEAPRRFAKKSCRP
jgi:hypothetical protein